MPGRGGRDLRNACAVVDPRGRHAATGVPVAHHANHVLIDQLLRDRDGRARIGLVIDGDEPVDHRLAADRRMRLVGIVQRELGAVLQVLADTSRRTCERRSQPDQHHLLILRMRCADEAC